MSANKYGVLIHRTLLLGKKYFLEILFPSRCVTCATTGTLLCEHCAPKLPRALVYEYDMAACFDYNNIAVRTLLWRFKYQGAREVAEICAPYLHEEILSLCAEHLTLFPQNTNITLVPVPLSQKREKTRGYNQAHTLAQALVAHAPHTYTVRTDILSRNRDTVSQTKMTSRTARARNVSGAFTLCTSTPLPEFVVVLDDVITSGATTKECAKLLKETGVPTVLRVAVAHGELK